ncbi:hypothetical protein ACMA5I_10240 [Paracoccaceae bacterium GXU_MW_L88]
MKPITEIVEEFVKEATKMSEFKWQNGEPIEWYFDVEEMPKKLREMLPTTLEADRKAVREEVLKECLAIVNGYGLAISTKNAFYTEEQVCAGIAEDIKKLKH